MRRRDRLTVEVDLRPLKNDPERECLQAWAEASGRYRAETLFAEGGIKAIFEDLERDPLVRAIVAFAGWAAIMTTTVAIADRRERLDKPPSRSQLKMFRAGLEAMAWAGGGTVDPKRNPLPPEEVEE